MAAEARIASSRERLAELEREYIEQEGAATMDAPIEEWDRWTKLGDRLRATHAAIVSDEHRLAQLRDPEHVEQEVGKGVATRERLDGLRERSTEPAALPREGGIEERIIAARRAGGTFPGIAAALNAEGIPAKRGGVWHPPVVRAICKKAGL